MNGVNVNSQSLLAKLLATENISVQYKNGITTAMFDLKNRVLLLPIWENITEDLRHLLIGHETGHALDSPKAEDYEKAAKEVAGRIFGSAPTSANIKAIRGFFNVIEDARIDKRQKRRYPGLRKNYLLGYKELFDRDFFGTSKRDINSMNFIDRANIYMKGGSVHMKIDFTPLERKFLKRMDDAETFDEVKVLVEEIYQYCKDSLNNIDHEDLILGLDGEEGDEDGNYDYDFGDGDDDADMDADSGTSDDSEDEEGESDGEDKPDTAAAEAKDVENEDDTEGVNSSGAGANAEVTERAPESETDRVWEEKVQSLVKSDNVDYIYLSLPEINWKKAVHSYKFVMADWRKDIINANGNRNRWTRFLDDAELKRHRGDMMAWRQKEKDSISFLVKEFESRKSAEMYARISIAKTGVIDTNKLHAYKYSDDIFRRLTILPEGKNHGFVMIVDWSGSMVDNLRQTIQQLFTLVLFCRQIQVPFEVYLFKDSNSDYPWIYPPGKKNVLGLGNVVLRQVLSSQMTTSELNEAMAVLWAIAHGSFLDCERLSGTPLNEAIILAPKIVNDFRAKYKLEIVNTIFLTDGDSNSLSGVKQEDYQRGFGTGKTQRYFYNDPVSGKTYDINPYSAWGDAGNTNTSTFLKILKDRTQSNLIGFYLWSGSWHYFCNRFGITSLGLQKVTKFWKDNKFYPVKSEGYDDYYVINIRELETAENKLVIDNTKSTKVMAKAFSKFATKKMVNRVLLRQFIEHVTSQVRKLA